MSWKNPRTTQEKRISCGQRADSRHEDFNIKVRGKRAKCNLPDTWDDLWTKDQRSWKRQSKRKKQWRSK